MLRVLRAGRQLVKYADALAAQERLADLRKSGAIGDTLIVLQVTINTANWAAHCECVPRFGYSCASRSTAQECMLPHKQCLSAPAAPPGVHNWQAREG